MLTLHSHTTQLEYANKAVENSGYAVFVFAHRTFTAAPPDADDDTVTFRVPPGVPLSLRRTAIGIKCKDGVILAVEKLVTSKLLVPGANKRIATIDTHAGIVSRSRDMSV